MSFCAGARWGGCRRAGEAEVGAADAERFQLELEFVQCLANPNYLNCECCLAGGLSAVSAATGRRQRCPPAALAGPS